jgi:hypothetical protein
MSSLILKRASATRQSGEWNEDDFDVVADGAVVGRIFLSPAAREATPTNLMLGKAIGVTAVSQPAPSSSLPRLLGEAR